MQCEKQNSVYISKRCKQHTQTLASKPIIEVDPCTGSIEENVGQNPGLCGLGLDKMVANWSVAFLYLRREGTKASLWLRGCSQARATTWRARGNDEVTSVFLSWGEVDIAATLIGGRNGK